MEGQVQVGIYKCTYGPGIDSDNHNRDLSTFFCPGCRSATFQQTEPTTQDSRAAAQNLQIRPLAQVDEAILRLLLLLFFTFLQALFCLILACAVQYG